MALPSSLPVAIAGQETKTWNKAVYRRDEKREPKVFLLPKLEAFGGSNNEEEENTPREEAKKYKP